MPLEKVLIRLSKDDEQEIHLYIPTMEAPKGYIKRWNPSDNSYFDVSLDSYKATKEPDAEQTTRTVKQYVKATGKREPKVALRLPRDYQVTGTDTDYILKSVGEHYIIEDAHGKLIRGYSNVDMAFADLDKLKKGKDL